MDNLKSMLNQRIAQQTLRDDAMKNLKEIENEIIIGLLRNNDHRCITVNWPKLERLILGSTL